MNGNIEKLHQRLYGVGGLGVTNLHLFPGTNPNITAEQVAGEILKSIDNIEAGNFEVVGDEESD